MICDFVFGYIILDFIRFGFMLDGVVCIGGFDFWDLDNWFWNFGFYYMCLDGLC